MKCIDHATSAVWSQHWFEFGESELMYMYCQSGPSLLLFFLVKFQLQLAPVVFASHAVRDHGSNEIVSPSVLFQSSDSFFSCLQHAGMVKVSRECCRLTTFWNFLNVYQHFLMSGLSWTGQPSLCDVAPVPLDWDYATRLDLGVSFLMCIDASACEQRLHVHDRQTSILYTLCETLKERCLAWPRGRWKLKGQWRKSSICCLVWADVPFWNRLFTTSCFDFSTNFRKFARRAKNAFGQSEHSSLTSHTISVCQMPLSTEKTPWCDSVLRQRKQWLSFSISQ